MLSSILAHASFAFCFPEMFHYMPLTRLQRIRCKGRAHGCTYHSLFVVGLLACFGPHPEPGDHINININGWIVSMSPSWASCPAGRPTSLSLQKGIGCSHIFASWEEKFPMLLACCTTWALLGWMHVSVQNSLQLCCATDRHHPLLPACLTNAHTHIYSVLISERKENPHMYINSTKEERPLLLCLFT
jgi:hypothetical protein